MLKTKKILSLLLVVLYVSYYASTNFFIHTHEGASGPVTHSHPYTSGTHTHSTFALQLIACLTTLFFIGGEMLLCIAILSCSKMIFCAVETRHATTLRMSGNQLRAPPVLA